MSAPTIPPRPQRAQAGPTAVQQQIPQIPPRPVRKSFDLETEREFSSRSPLNDRPPSASNGNLYSHTNTSGSEIRRPPSVSLPSIGQEGNEYASFDQLPPEAHGVAPDITAEERDPDQTEQVRHATGLPMHAPIASVAQSTAKARIQPVTRTDSSQAAAAGVGKTPPASSKLNPTNEGGETLSRTTSREKHSLRERASFNRSSASLPKDASTPRPPSIYADDEEHGIPEIGMQIPLLKHAGDVQAPSPSPAQTQFAPGIGFFNDGTPRNHHRKRSSRQEFRYEDQYGRSHEYHDQFEKSWAAKHPKEAAREEKAAQLPRPESALTSAELNRLVNQDEDVASSNARDAISTPSQEIGWAATDQYASRMSSPRPSPLPYADRKKRSSSGNQTAIESPLRKSSRPDEGFPIDRKGSSDRAMESEDDGGWFDERGSGIPILASDELTKRPSSAFLQPAVNPEGDRPSSEADDDYAHSRSRRNSSQANSRPTSRPGSRPSSIHGNVHGSHGLHRFISHEDAHAGSGVGTPLEEIEEYEPLFPEDDKYVKPKATDKIKKRPDLARHHFPSQDIWEDTPDSLKYETYVQTPEPERTSRDLLSSETDKSATASAFETPAQEANRRSDNDKHSMLNDSKTFAKPKYKGGVQDEVSRPGVQRFPSSDIWEDTPESMLHVTTVSGPQEDELMSPSEEKSAITAAPSSQSDPTDKATTGTRPQIPTRPGRKSKLSEEMRPEGAEATTDEPTAKDVSPTKTQAPSIPDRPKPAVPNRPARKLATEEANGAPLDKSISAGSTGSQETVREAPPVAKAKPSVPARPTGSKIAALQAGFMQDLNSRLKLGPQGPPPKAKEVEPEAEVEKAPLADARKSRAKGPPRRKPAASPSPSENSGAGFSFVTPVTMWTIDESDELNVPADEAGPDTDGLNAEKIITANVSKN
ncbi:hypothetical protein K431DRAFT_208322, partial [Polychaeton citri CBS 116435]